MQCLIVSRSTGVKGVVVKFQRAIIFLILLLSTRAFAGFSCSGPVSGVALTPGGALVVQELMAWRYQVICNMNTTSNGVEPKTCQAIYAMFLTAQTTQRSITMWFDSGDCNSESQADWSALENWYYGPLLNK